MLLYRGLSQWAPATTDDNAWLFQSQLLHDLGYADAHNHFMLHSLRAEFDAVLFLRDSTPVPLLP